MQNIDPQHGAGYWPLQEGVRKVIAVIPIESTGKPLGTD